MIPKVIHYCWFGGNPKSQLIKKCIESWKKFCPEYEIIEWNESNFDIHVCPYVEEAYNAKKWAFVSDYVRLWVIYNYGGIYLDTDVELTNKIDFLTKYEVFLCFEDEKYINTGLGFGAIKNNNIIKQLLDDYNDISFIKNDQTYDITACPIRNTECIKNIVDKISDNSNISLVDNCAFIPKDYFCPLDYETGKLKITDRTVGIHWYSGSWLSGKQLFRNKITGFIKRIIGKKNYKRIIKLVKSIKNNI